MTRARSESTKAQRLAQKGHTMPDDDQTCLAHGYMMKQSIRGHIMGRGRNWKRRYFVLHAGPNGAALRYFTSENEESVREAELAGCIPVTAESRLCNISAASPLRYVGASGGYACFTLSFVRENREIEVICGCEHAAQRDKWVEILEKARTHRPPPASSLQDVPYLEAARTMSGLNRSVSNMGVRQTPRGRDETRRSEQTPRGGATPQSGLRTVNLDSMLLTESPQERPPVETSAAHGRHGAPGVPGGSAPISDAPQASGSLGAPGTPAFEGAQHLRRLGPSGGGG